MSQNQSQGDAQVQDRMLQVVREVLGREDVELADSTRAADVPGWDSLAHINIMYSLEAEFGVQFSDEQLSSFQDVGELQRFLADASA